METRQGQEDIDLYFQWLTEQQWKDNEAIVNINIKNHETESNQGQTMVAELS